MYALLFVVGILIGAIFLVILLIGDRRESVAKNREQELQRSIRAANEHHEGTWPPPPTHRDVPAPRKNTSPPTTLSHQMYKGAGRFYRVVWLYVFICAAVTLVMHSVIRNLSSFEVFAVTAILVALVDAAIGKRRTKR